MFATILYIAVIALAYLVAVTWGITVARSTYRELMAPYAKEWAEIKRQDAVDKNARKAQKKIPEYAVQR